MSKYEEIIQMMREEGKTMNSSGIELATMTGPDSCKIGDFPLFAEDLYIADYLLSQIASKVSVTESHVDKSIYLQPLKTGDTVALQRLNDTQYLILARVVNL